MAGWRKAWLSVLDRGGGGGGGGGSGSVNAHLQGVQPRNTSSSSSLDGHGKRGGGGCKNGGGYVSGKVVMACFSAALALAFFYVAVTSGGPTAGDSFPSQATSSEAAASAIVMSWLSSNSTPSHPPIPPPPPPAVTTVGGAADLRGDAGNATAGPRRVQTGVEDSSSSERSEQLALMPKRTANTKAGNTTVVVAGSEGDPVGNATRAEEPQEETAMPTTTRLRRTDRASSSHDAVIGDPGKPAGDTDVTTGVSTTETGMPRTSSKDETTKDAATVGVQSSPRQQAATSSVLAPRDDYRRRRRRAVRHRHARRRKEIALPALEAAAGDRGDSDAGAVSTGTAVAADANTSVAIESGDNRVVWTSGVQDLVSFARCDVFSGRWVRDEGYGFYPPTSCPHIDDDFNCHKNGRPDSDFLKWRWQPHGCDIPRLNATEFLERLRGQRIIFVGDSLNRNMWESLVCVLRHGVRDKRNVYEASGRNQFKTRGYYSFRFREYNCSVDFIRSIFLVKEVIREGKNGTDDAKLKLDEMDETTPSYMTADIVVFNTAHWWTHLKTSRGLNYFQEGNHVYPSLEVLDAYKRALTTWARWVDKNIDSRRTQVVYRGYSLAHFRGGPWNSGGRCHRETEPIFNQTYLTNYPEKMVILEQVLRQMKTPVIYLNISTLTDYRKDGHPSVYRVRYETEEERMAAVTKQDCSHWCLPGVPDTWNELLYASLLKAGKGSWKL